MLIFNSGATTYRFMSKSKDQNSNHKILSDAEKAMQRWFYGARDRLGGRSNRRKNAPRPSEEEDSNNLV